MDPTTLSSYDNGNLEIEFQEEYGKLLDNILDPKKDLSTRELRVVFKIKPNEDRSGVSMEATIHSKMGNTKPLEVTADIVNTGEGPYTLEHPKQVPIPFQKAND